MNEDALFAFECDHCKQMIEVSPDLIGESIECPACGQKLVVPDNRDDGIVRHGADEPSAASREAEKSRTIRIELGDL